MNPITRIFKNKAFSRFAKKADIKDCELCKAVANAEKGLIDANLGGGVIKQRIAREGEGKSGGFRTLILLKIGNRAFFVYGFAKNEKDNIESDDLMSLKKLAAIMLNYTDDQLSDSLNKNILIEVQCHE